jgi:hypothetical protein
MIENYTSPTVALVKDFLPAQDVNAVFFAPQAEGEVFAAAGALACTL